LLAYRCNPMLDVHVEPYRSSGPAPKSGLHVMDSTLLIDATLKYPMAPLALPAKEFMEQARALWKELDLPTLNIHSPLIGYSLGGWTETWDRFAKTPWMGLGKERREHLGAATRWAHAGNSAAEGRDDFPAAGLALMAPQRACQGSGGRLAPRWRLGTPGRFPPAQRKFCDDCLRPDEKQLALLIAIAIAPFEACQVYGRNY
jgi:hypothetical protein